MSKSSKEYHQQYYQQHKEEIRERQRKSRKANPASHKESSKKWVEEHKEQHKENCKQWRKANRDKCNSYERKFRGERREWFYSIKQELQCKECGESRWFCLEFHHRDPKEKEANLSAIYWRWPKERILEEIAKCDVLCGNCHKALHWEEQNKGEE